MSEDDGKDDAGSGKNEKPNTNNPWGNVTGINDRNRGQKNANNSNNPWGNDNNPQSQNLDDLAKRIEDKLRAALGGGGGSPPPTSSGTPRRFDNRMLSVAGMVIGALWLASGVYVVDAGEEALVSRFGKYVRFAEQGLSYRLPFPFESHNLVNVQRVNTLTVGASSAAGAQDDGQGLMLTGDENIVNVSFQVFWRVKNAQQFQFNVAHGANNRGEPSDTVSAVAEASMREVVGRSPLEKVLTTGRATVESQTRELMQRTLNSYNSGILVTQVNLRRAEPPASVIASFREVAAASQEAETRINQALSYRNSVLPQAQGEATRFNQLYQEYHLAPEVTRQRLYLETMEKIYERSNKIIMNNNRAGAAPMMVLPPELFRNFTNAQPQARVTAPAENAAPTGGSQ
ncbi:MAG: membrane protease subunit HflK [Hyphomonadaceae bacterium]|nr:MAG: membrane protease subunit HflK [Hyphomonadaceae bacterium]